MVPETLYVIQATYASGRGYTGWSVSEANAARVAEAREEDDDVTSVIVYEMDLPELIDGALDNILNGEYPATDLIIVREYSV